MIQSIIQAHMKSHLFDVLSSSSKSGGISRQLLHKRTPSICCISHFARPRSRRFKMLNKCIFAICRCSFARRGADLARSLFARNVRYRIEENSSVQPSWSIFSRAGIQRTVTYRLSNVSRRHSGIAELQISNLSMSHTVS